MAALSTLAACSQPPAKSWQLCGLSHAWSPLQFHGLAGCDQASKGTKKGQELAAQAGGQAGSEMDDNCPLTTGMGQASSGQPSWQGQNIHQEAERALCKQGEGWALAINALLPGMSPALALGQGIPQAQARGLTDTWDAPA